MERKVLITSVDIKNAVLATPFSKDGKVRMGKAIHNCDTQPLDFLNNCFVDADFISQDMLAQSINTGDAQFALNEVEDFDHFAERKEIQRQYKYSIKRRSEKEQKEHFEKDLLGADINDIEHRTYSTIFLIEGPAGCGKSTYANFLLRNSFKVDLCNVETATQKSCSLFKKTYDFVNPRLNPITSVEVLLLSVIHKNLAKKYDETEDAYAQRLNRICEIYNNQFNSDKIVIKDSLEFRTFFENLLLFCRSGLSYGEMSNNIHMQIDEVIKDSDMVINSDKFYDDIHAIKFLLGVLMRVYFCMSKVDGDKYILFLDNIERYIISETGTPYITIFDVELQKILNSIYSVADETEDLIYKTYEELSKVDNNVRYKTSFGILIAVRESTLNLLKRDHSFSEYFEVHHSENVPTYVNISNWFDYYKIFTRKINYFLGITDEKSNLFTHTFYNILSDITLSKWSLRRLLLDMFNNNFRRFFSNMTEVFCYYEDIIKYYNEMWDKTKTSSTPKARHIRHLCRKLIIRAVLDYMQNVKNAPAQRGFFDDLMARCDVISPNNEIIAKSSYARRIITFLDNMNNKHNPEPVAFPTLIEVLLHKPIIKEINKSNVSLNDKRIDDIAEILDIASQTAKLHTNGVELVILNVNSSELSKSGLSKMMKDQWNTYRTLGKIDNSIYNIRITPAGSVFAMLFPSFEYFACRYKNNSVPLFMLKNEDERRELLFGENNLQNSSLGNEIGIYYRAMNCIDSVLKYETRILALTPINKKHSAANATYAKPKWLFNYSGSGNGMVHALRIVRDHLGYLGDYREFLANISDNSYDNEHYINNDGKGVIDEAIAKYKWKYYQIIEDYRNYVEIGNVPDIS